jgi:hypothetical protein
MKNVFKISLISIVAIAGSKTANANTILDFEAPLPDGLVAMSYIQGTPVPISSVVTNQFIDFGVSIENAALVSLGVGHAASGSNSLAGFNSNNQLDYDQSVKFNFFAPGGGLGTTDFFAYSGDLIGGSGNIVTISAFDLGGNFLASSSFTENVQYLSRISIFGVGNFHSIVVDQTLYNTNSGGIAIDLVEFGTISPIPEPETYALMLAGLAVVGAAARRRKAK